MPVKRSRKNQKAGATLRPVEIEKQVPLEALARFEANALKRKPGDQVYGSMDALIKDLHRMRHVRNS